MAEYTDVKKIAEVEQVVGRLYDLYEEINPVNATMLREHVESIYDDLAIDFERCDVCTRPVPAATSHFHRELGSVGDVCCWDERLASTA